MVAQKVGFASPSHFTQQFRRLVGVSGGDLAIGIATTIPLVVYGSTLLTSLLDRFPIP